MNNSSRAPFTSDTTRFTRANRSVTILRMLARSSFPQHEGGSSLMCGNNGVPATGIGKCFEATMQRWISSGQAPSIRFGGIGLARVNIKRRMAHGAQSQLTSTLPSQILSSSPLGSSQTPSPGTTRNDFAELVCRGIAWGWSNAISGNSMPRQDPSHLWA